MNSNATRWTRLKLAAQSLRRFITPTAEDWSVATRLMLAVWALLFLSFILINIIPNFSIEKLIGLVAMFTAMAVVSLGLLLVIGIASAMKRSFRVGLLLALPPLLLLLVLTWGVAGALIGAGVSLIALILVVGAAATLLRRGPSTGPRLKPFTFLALGMILIGLSAYALLKPVSDPNPELTNHHLVGRSLPMPDPGKPGPYAVTYFTYGSGKDRRRPEFAAGARFLSKSVDGSRLDKLWTGPDGWLRTHYWGFDATALPLQGRVWMPQAASPGAEDGPFPLVLLVHGNYEMEVPSDTGYAYLGELLASHGFIVVSVDENFLNGSIADFLNPRTFRFGKENKVRGWLLLEHLTQWQAWNDDHAHPLFGRIDMSRIGLIGHSRGGEAVAIANALNDLDRDPDDATVALNYHFKLRAIGAIAPADGQYLLRGRPTPMRDTNYFVIEGSMDGDVTSFVGSAQYARASFSGATKAFKASVYVKGANHTQFSTGWGRYDVWLPSKFLLDERPIMAPEDQRQILKVYLSAFLQATLNGKDAFRPLFQDARSGADWLPQAYLVNNYADSDTTWLANYLEDIDPTTGSAPGVKISGANLAVWRESFIDLKSSPLGAYAAVLGWDDRFSKRRASYGIELGDVASRANTTTALVFSASDAGTSTLPEGFDLKDDGTQNTTGTHDPLDWTIVMTDTNGTEARLALSQDASLYPQIKGQTLRISALNSTVSSEIVLRRYQYPLKDFAAVSPHLDLTHLRSVRFDFDRTARGVIVLSDVGLAKMY
jgi:Chlorophyllase enzyme